RLRPGFGTAVRLERDLPADLPIVPVDSETLRCVVSRLLDNAREAIPGSGVIRVSARRIDWTPAPGVAWFGSLRPGSHVELTIADTGTGLNEKVRPRLMVEPFVTTKPQRLGLGLAIVFRALFMHHGGIRLEPHTPTGTIARVLLPLMAQTWEPAGNLPSMT